MVRARVVLYVERCLPPIRECSSRDVQSAPGSLTPACRPRRSRQTRVVVCPSLTYSQPRRRKATYRARHISTIRAIEKGYPRYQDSSGMWRKFIP